MAYRALKMRKVEREIQLLDKQLVSTLMLRDKSVFSMAIHLYQLNISSSSQEKQ